MQMENAQETREKGMGVARQTPASEVEGVEGSCPRDVESSGPRGSRASLEELVQKREGSSGAGMGVQSGKALDEVLAGVTGPR